MSFKFCNKCECSIDETNSYKTAKHLCKSCHKAWRREYYLANREEQIKYAETYQKDNPLLTRKAKTKWNKKRRHTDPVFKLAVLLRRRTLLALKAKKFTKTNTLHQYLGCSCSELKAHLESQFKPGMTWENHSLRGWHIDHIIPISSASTPEELYKLCHFSNLQPLWATENLKKSDKLLRVA